MRGPGALVSQGEKRGNAFHLMRHQLLENLLVTYPLSESSDNRCIGDTRNGTPYLVKHEMNARSVSSGFCLTAWRWASTPCCWYALAKFAVNLTQSSSQDRIVPE